MGALPKISISKSRIKVYWFFLLFVCLLPILVLINRPGYWVSDDGEWMVIRLSAFYQEVANGQFPVRWLGRLNHEYGYPVANFLYPGFLYLGSLIHFMGFGLVDTVKLLFSLGVVALAFGTFLWLKKTFIHLAAFTGAVVSVYLPYFLFDIFRRGSIGEVLSLASLPFLLLAVDQKNFPVASLLFSWLIMAHNSLALIFIPIVCFYLWLKEKKMTVKVIVFGAGISGFFWLPAISEQSFVIFPHVAISDWTRYFLTGTNFFLIGPLGMMIGLITIYLFFSADSRRSHIFILFTTVSLLALALTLPWSTFIWAHSSLPTLIQFPWRFLSVIALTFPYFIALFVVRVRSRKKRILVTGVVLAISLVQFYPFTSLERIDKGDSYYSTNDSTTTVHAEYTPIWVRESPKNRPQQKITSGKNTTVTLFDLKSSRMKFTVESSVADVIDIHTLYYPGWIVKSNNQVVHIDPWETNGYIKIPIDKGKTELTVYFSETITRLIADCISVASIVVLIYLSFRKTMPTTKS